MYICYLYYFVSLKIIVAHIHMCSSLFINMKINVLMFINGNLNTLLLDTPYLGVIYHILASLGGVHTPLNSP